MSINDDNRLKIFEIIYENPGIHFRKLLEMSRLEVGVIDYHTRILEKSNDIFSISHKGYRLFFDHRWENNIDQVLKLIGYLRKSTPRKVLTYLLLQESANRSLKEIAEILEIAQSTLNWHIKRMIDDDLIIPIRHGRQVTLKLNMDWNIVNNIGNEIYANRWEKFLDFINDSFPI